MTANKVTGFYALFAIQFLLIACKIFMMNVKVGLFSLLLTIICCVLTIIQLSNDEKTDWRPGNNLMLILFAFWTAYCIMEIGNPNTVMAAWNVSMVPYALIPLICAFLTPIVIRTVKDIEKLLLIWSVFAIIVTIKTLWQQFIGFSEIDRYFLYALGGWRTHIIWSGIRYFSCFSDAAAYGIHAAVISVVFGISAFYTQGKWKRLYYLFISGCGLYGMGVSGTRAAIAVVLVGLAMTAVLAKNTKVIGISATILAATFCFFYFTTIGNGNAFIFKMRSAFRPTQDASYIVRVENRKKMKVLMASKPIGYGLGLSKAGGEIQPRERMPYPPDSWLIAVWVETGIIGICLYLGIHGFLFAWGSYLLMFKVKNKRLRGMAGAWLCANAGFFVACYANDAMQYPNPIVVYTGFAICFAAPFIDKRIEAEQKEKKRKEKKHRLLNFRTNLLTLI